MKISDIQPRDNNAVITLCKAEEKTVSGIIIPGTAKADNVGKVTNFNKVPFLEDMELESLVIFKRNEDTIEVACEDGTAYIVPDYNIVAIIKHN